MSIERFSPTGHNCFTVLDEHGVWVDYADHLAEVERVRQEYEAQDCYQLGYAHGLNADAAEAMRSACIAAVEAQATSHQGGAMPPREWVHTQSVLAALREVTP